LTKEQIEKMIRLFEAMRLRPGMYFGALEVLAILNYFHGFYDAFGFMGIDTTKDGKVWNALIEKHGLSSMSAADPSTQMEMLGYDGERIVDETLVLEIEYWQHILAEIEDENSNENS
jgi:hypothetical protein